MITVNAPITGDENIVIKSNEPIFALIEFYKAFNAGDMKLMEANWDASEEASMSNPLGGIKRGWGSITEVYKNIFYGEAEVYVEFYDYSIHQTENMFCAVGRERGSLKLGKNTIELAIRTSRTFRMHDGRWKQIHHHGSMDNPQLLEQYQRIILNKEQGNE